jgi:hypothetical protein
MTAQIKRPVGRPVKQVARVNMRVPYTFRDRIMECARESRMDATDFLDEALPYMKLHGLERMERNYASDCYEAQMASDERDRLVSDDDEPEEYTEV